MTHEEAKMWLTVHNLFPRVTPVAEPGMWHLRKEDDGSMEFVHRRLGKSLPWERPQPHQNVQAGPTAPATFVFTSVARSPKATRKKAASWRWLR